MSELSDFLKLIAEGKKTDPVAVKAKEQREYIQEVVKEDLGSLFSQLATLKNKQKELQIQAPIVEEVLIERIYTEPPTEPIPAAQVHSTSEIDKYLTTKSFQQPNPDKVSPELKAVTEKIKFLEQAIGRIAATGPGSGEVNLRYLDDVDRSTIANGLYLRYNSTKKKFEFAEVEDIDYPAQIQSDWTQTDNSKLDYIKHKPTIPAAQIQSDWSQADDTKLDYIKNKPAPVVGAVLYKGLYNVSTNTPAITDATGQSGWEYTVYGSGTVNFGNGNLSVQDGDLLIHNGTHYDLIPGPRTQVNSDWDAVSGVAKILNKPTIPAAQIQSDWNQTNNTSLDYIKNKPSIPSLIDDLSDVVITNPQVADVLKYNGTNWVNDPVNGSAGSLLKYGSYYDTQTQSLTQQQVTDFAAQPVYVRNYVTQNGISVVDGYKITASRTSVYNLQFSFQFHNEGGGGNGQTVEIWLNENGTWTPDSNTRVAVNTNSPYVVAAWNFMLPITAGNWVSLMWYTDNHHIVMPYNTGTAGFPKIPSAIITITEI